MIAALCQGMALSQINPLQKEFADYYVEKISSIAPGEKKTLDCWVENEMLIPILTKVARRFLCVSASSRNMERLFSRAGLICTKLRNSLALYTILCLSTLH